MNTDKIYAEHIVNEYSPKQASKVKALKKLDAKAKNPANIFAYTFGIISSLVLGIGMTLAMGEPHAVLTNIEPDAITVSRFIEATYDDTYKTLMYCDGRPVLTVKNDKDAKVAVMGFSLHYSNLAILPEFPLFINNIFQYFYPSTVTKDSFEVGEKIELNARGESLTVLRDGASEEETVEFTEFPSTLEVSLPGTYTITQTTFGNKVKESIFVTIPMSECNIWSKEDALTEPYRVQDDTIVNQDLLLYFAAALVAILFMEWLLQLRDNM